MSNHLSAMPSLLQLPFEIIQKIFDYLLFPSDDHSSHRMFATTERILLACHLQNIHPLFSQSQLMTDYFNRFWWTLFRHEIHFGNENEMVIGSEKELKELKEMACQKKGSNLRRMILLWLVVKRMKVSQQPYQENECALVLGQAGVGKTSLIHQFVHKHFVVAMPSSSEDETFRTHIMVDGQMTFLEIWNPTEKGVDSFGRALPLHYIRHSNCLVLVCSTACVVNTEENEPLNIHSSYLSYFEYWLPLMVEVKGVHVPCVFVLNKMDLIQSHEFDEDTIDKKYHLLPYQLKQQLQQLAQKYSLTNYAIIESSATDYNSTFRVFEEGVKRYRCYQGYAHIDLLKQIVKNEKKVLKQIRKEKKCEFM